MHPSPSLKSVARSSHRSPTPERGMAKLISQPNTWIPYTGRPVVTWVPIITVNTGGHWRLRGIARSVWRLNRPPPTIVVIVPLTI